MFDSMLLFDFNASSPSTSTNQIKVDRDIGAGGTMYLNVIAEAGKGPTAVELKGGSASTSLSVSHGKWSVDEDALERGGCVLSVVVPPFTSKYLGLAYTGATGKVTAGLALAPHTDKGVM